MKFHSIFTGLVVVFASLLTTSLTPTTTFAKPPRQIDREVLAAFDLLLPKKSIDVRRMGVNAFVNDGRFGSIKNQLREVKDGLGIRYVRVLFNWDDNVQPTPSSAPNFSFYDEIARSIPANTEALVILTGLPSWMRNSENWIDGDPVKTYVERWAVPVAARYARTARIKAFQIWNEPNDVGNSENTVLGFVTSPTTYAAAVALASQRVRAVSPGKRIVCAATTSINQNFPSTLNYNRDMKTAGVLSSCDVFAVHYYGKQYERIVFGGIGSFLKSVAKPIWLTESGQIGITKQREYLERTWPFLRSQVPGIQRLYYYQFTDNAALSNNYGMKNLGPGTKTSDLYRHLKDRQTKARRRGRN